MIGTSNSDHTCAFEQHEFANQGAAVKAPQTIMLSVIAEVTLPIWPFGALSCDPAS